MLADVVKRQISKKEGSKKEGVPSILLMDEIGRNWEKRREVRVPTLVEQDEEWKEFWLYASDTKNWCPRACALKALLPIEAGKIGLEDLWNFGQGHAYHGLFQNDILPSLGNRLLGSWKRYVVNPDGLSFNYRKEETDPVAWLNGEEGRRYLFTDDEGDQMLVVRPWLPRPPGEGWEYVESKVRMMQYRIVVKMDAILEMYDGELEVLELKSATQRMRDKYDPLLGGSPRPEHVDQVHLAMWATGARRARIVYIFKGDFIFRASFVEHEIQYDEKIIDRLKGVASECVSAVRKCDEIKASVELEEAFLGESEEAAEWWNENFPRLQDCLMKSKGMARYCNCRDACFPGKGKKKK